MSDYINRTQLTELEELLEDNLSAWQDEEDSVKDEHSELIERLEALDLNRVFVIPRPQPPFRRMVCSTCGSERVLADAFARWNYENQEWELQNTFDKGSYCEGECDGECRIEEIEVEIETKEETSDGGSDQPEHA
jgi:hypothetical protein